MSAGVIILITSAGGAFGAMLREAGLGDAIRDLAETRWRGGAGVTAGLPLLTLAFGVAGLIRFAQGSTTTAMIVTSGMVVGDDRARHAGPPPRLRGALDRTRAPSSRPG